MDFSAAEQIVTTDRSGGGQGSLSARESTMSAMTNGTFRDTNVHQNDADSLLHAQSLSSIVNNPKKDSLVKKMASLVKSKVVGSSVPKFKKLEESQVEDSPAIPKVNPQKDFKDYIKKVSKPSVKTYQQNHPQKSPEEFEQQPEEESKGNVIKEVDPFAVKKEREEPDSPFGKSAEVLAK